MTLPFWVQIIICDNYSWNLLLITALRLKPKKIRLSESCIFVLEKQELLNYCHTYVTVD